jgi:hypothetical protein
MRRLSKYADEAMIDASLVVVSQEADGVPSTKREIQSIGMTYTPCFRTTSVIVLMYVCLWKDKRNHITGLWSELDDPNHALVALFCSFDIGTESNC